MLGEITQADSISLLLVVDLSLELDTIGEGGVEFLLLVGEGT